MNIVERFNVVDQVSDQQSLNAARYLSCVVRADYGPSAAAAQYEAAIEHDLGRARYLARAAVSPGTRLDATWGAPLAQGTPFADGLVAVARTRSVVSLLPLVDVPFGTPAPIMTGNATAQWVGENVPTPVGKLAFGSAVVDPSKVAIIIALVEELVRSTSPAATARIRDAIADAVALAVDKEFLDETKAPVAGGRPGSVLNGITPVATGANAAATAQAVATAHMLANPESTLSRMLFSPDTVAKINSTLPLQPLTIAGGSFLGIPAIVAGSVGNKIVAIDGGAILRNDDGLELDTSRNAAVQMNDAPDPPATASTVITSFFQSNIVGFRAVRFVSWKRTRNSAVTWAVA